MKKVNFNDIKNSSRETVRLSQNEIFELLKTGHDYWGENTVHEMLDFCRRNKLDWLVKPLESLKLID